MALPERLVSNEQIAAGLGVDAAWIAKRTGTRERPWATRGRAPVSSSPRRPAGPRSSAPASSARELDLVLVATSTADEITPNAAPLVAGPDRRRARRRARRRRRLHGLAVGAGDGLRPDRVRARPACARRRAPTSCRASSTSPIATPRRCSPTAPAPRSCRRPRSPAGRIGPIVLRADPLGFAPDPARTAAISSA